MTELGRRLGVDKSTAHRLLATLAGRGYARLNPHTQRYQLGLRLVGLGAVAARGVDVTEVARPALESLRDDTGEARLPGRPLGRGGALPGQGHRARAP